VRDPTHVLWRRTLAHATSLLLIALVLIAAGYAGDVHTTSSGCPKPVPAGQSCFQRGSTGYLMKNAGFLWFALAAVLLGLVLFVVPQVRAGSSLGKVVFGIRVVRPDGRPPGFLRSSVRLLALDPRRPRAAPARRAGRGHRHPGAPAGRRLPRRDLRRLAESRGAADPGPESPAPLPAPGWPRVGSRLDATTAG
jgi:uncharacterized RDD family membrane protein YckC